MALLRRSRALPQGGFWNTEYMRQRLPGLISPYSPGRVTNCAYEMSLGPEVFVTGAQSSTKIILSDNEQTIIPPGQFAQLLSEEFITIPRDAIGLISLRSRFKFWGLVNVSGFHVDPGFHGRLVFSVYNAGPRDIAVSRGSPVFLLWYSTLVGPTNDGYTGDRGGQGHISDEDVMRLQGQVSTPQSLAIRMSALEDRATAGIDSVNRELSSRIKRLEDRLVRRWQIALILFSVFAGALITLVLSNLEAFSAFIKALF